MSPIRPLRTRLKSCRHCREHKLRCDRVVRAPRPCTTCWNRGLDCVFPAAPGERGDGPYGDGSIDGDSIGRIESMTVAENRSDDRHWPGNASKNASDGAAVSTTTSPWSGCTVTDFQPYDGPDLAVDGITVSAAQIDDHFAYFFKEMHPCFPFLSESLSTSNTCRNSPLLFWTVLAVASSHRDRSLYKPLQRLVRRLIAGVLYPSGHGLETCQALCLVCLWPFEAQEPNDEPSYLYACLATHLALRLGLHRPEHPHEFKDINNPGLRPQPPANHDRWRTWCACQFVEYMLSSKTGVPSSVRQDWPTRLKLTSITSDGGPVISPVVRNSLLICWLRDRHVNALAYDGRTSAGLLPPEERMDQLRLFAAALDDFEVSSGLNMDPLSAILLNMVRVTIAGFCLAQDLQLQPNLRAECTAFILSGLTFASATLELVAPLAWETLPVHILRAVLYAGVFAAQVLRLGIGGVRDQSLGSGPRDPLEILQRATDILRHLAYGNDFSTRAKIVLETAVKRHATSESGEGTDLHSASASQASTASAGPGNDSTGVTFQARMGANMYWNMVESEKKSHNWNQTADDIYRELMVSGIYSNISVEWCDKR